MTKMSQSQSVAYAGLFVAVVSAIATVLTVPEARKYFHLDDPVAPSLHSQASASAPYEHTDAPNAEPKNPLVVSGKWLVSANVDHTSYRPFLGLSVLYDMTIQQVGDRVTGSGTKIQENGKDIPLTSRVPITFDGHITDRVVRVTYVLHGSRRTSTGSFTWTIAPDGSVLDGKFVGDINDTRGTSHGQRVDYSLPGSAVSVVTTPNASFSPDAGRLRR